MKKKVCVLLLMFVVIVSASYGAIGDVWDLSEALLASVDPNTAKWVDANFIQNPYTDGDGTWNFHAGTPGETYATPTVAPSADFNPELPTEGRGWGINHVCLVSYLSADSTDTNYQAGDVGGHGSTGATWTADVGGQFLIEYSAWNARTSHNGRNMAFTLTVAGIIEDQLDVPDTTYPDSFNRYEGTPLVATLSAGQSVTMQATAGDWMGISLKITEFDASAQSDLTIAANPAYVNMVLPYVGTDTQSVGVPIAIEAQRYVDCDNNREVLVFDHWEAGANASIANVNAASTTVTIGAPIDSDITAVYADGAVCGDECHLDPEDLVLDCTLNLLDLAELAKLWQYDDSVQ